MKQAFAYGLKDSLLLIHNWQRWGYDYRLPDVWPPNPQFGALEEMQEISKVCAAADVPWGLHDNYIDFYPDAAGFSYDHITFNEQGQPKKAWINLGRDAQSYQWRPDQIMPFVQRNVKLIQDGVHPTASFLDVFAASGTFDYYDREGKFHPKTETRKCWGDVFAWIRETLGNNAAHVFRGRRRSSHRLARRRGLPVPATGERAASVCDETGLLGLGSRSVVRRGQSRALHSARRRLFPALPGRALARAPWHRKRRLYQR